MSPLVVSDYKVSLPWNENFSCFDEVQWELYRPEFMLLHFSVVKMIIQQSFTHMVHVITKNTWEPASRTEPEQFTCCNKVINYIFLYFLFHRNWSVTLTCREKIETFWSPNQSFMWQAWSCTVCYWNYFSLLIYEPD